MTVTLERSDDGQVATLRFASGHPLNVLDSPTLDDLLARVRELAADRTIRVLLITGSESVFSGGADLRDLGGLDDDAYRHYIATEYRLFAEVEALPLITVAVIAGPCVGNGAELALACDFRICATDTRIGLPEMRVGFVSPAQRLATYVGIGKAKELLYGGRLLPAAEALELGLVTTVTDDLPGETERAARRWAGCAPTALAITKAGLHRCYGIDADPPGRTFDAQEQAAAFATFRGPDFAEGSAAALEGRRPVFTAPRTDILGGTRA
ncbi:enoyl-CoA hydratase/isomerase family protein [Actinomycetospora endophytica]|uniref:Enoyl-CoA hydratase/isomerase family protein n=1 Tax=Actinomycetospora endophytica TaxID=2291215 RepID=A0ABS8P920_9PSEU|nr:enoyl-CoA hydratase/isomerase family protein [Actinomycetospora endophytica]MCD2194736.1 enoyl-CoA hydratase/isomerase family protein [Actinomycetospora endophytica]